MELVFQTSPMTFLQTVLQQTKTQEETAETIVPDALPDITSIADCYAYPILRGKDCRPGSVSISGGIKGAIFYTPEDGTYPRMLEIYIPFNMKFEHPKLTEQSQIQCSLRVGPPDARMINSRKALLRVEVICQIMACEEWKETKYSLEEKPEHLHLKTASYPMHLPVEMAEKSFLIQETLSPGSGAAPMGEVYKFSCRPEILDEKLVGNKGVFKGMLHCKLLYLSENETLYLHKQQIPFSQYCDLVEDYDGETLEVHPVVTGYDLETETDAAGGKSLFLSVHILAQATIYGTQELPVIEDAYSTTDVFTPQWNTYDMKSFLDRQSETYTVRQQVSGKFQEVLDCDVYWKNPGMTNRNNQMEVAYSLKIRVLGYDPEGNLQMVQSSDEIKQVFSLGEQAFCMPCLQETGSCSASQITAGAEVRFDCMMDTACYADEEIRGLCGGTLEEGKKDKRPSMILKTVPEGTHLWDLAKETGSTQKGIMEVNHLEQEILTEDLFLLLPKG